jgi:hypothetical protein
MEANPTSRELIGNKGICRHEWLWLSPYDDCGTTSLGVNLTGEDNGTLLVHDLQPVAPGRLCLEKGLAVRHYPKDSRTIPTIPFENKP